MTNSQRGPELAAAIDYRCKNVLWLQRCSIFEITTVRVAEVVIGRTEKFCEKFTKYAVAVVLSIVNTVTCVSQTPSGTPWDTLEHFVNPDAPILRADHSRTVWI